FHRRRPAEEQAPEQSPLSGPLAADLACLAVRAAIDRLSAALARAAASFVRLRAWNVFGFARIEDLARERYGRSGRWLRDLATLGDGIAATPALARALTGADGGRPLGRVAATLVARALPLDPPISWPAEPPPPNGADALPAGPRNGADALPEDRWIAAARRLSVRELRDSIRAARAEAETSAAAGNRAQAPACAGFDSRSEAAACAGSDSRCGSAARNGSDAASDSETDPDADRLLLRLPVPAPILAAFEEARDLHRAVEGRGTSLAEFVESLVGEAQSGGLAPEPGLLGALEHGVPEARIEAALRRASGAWEALPEPWKALPDPSLPIPQHAAERWSDRPGLLERFAEVEARAGEGDAVALDRQIAALVRLEDELEAGLGLLLAGMAEHRDWLRLQFAGVGHYAEERLGMSRSRAGERARLARALRSLPAVAAACSEGRISMEAAALVHRILADALDAPAAAGVAAAADLEDAWVAHASRITIKRMRDEARALGRYKVCPGPPLGGAPGGNGAGAEARVGDQVGPPPLSDEQWSASLHRQAGTALHRIREFGLRAAGLIPPGRPSSPAEPDVFHAAAAATEPDVFHALLHEADTFLRLRLPADLAADFLAAIEAARARAEERAATVPWDAPWPPANGASGPPIDGALGAGLGLDRNGAGTADWAARIAFVRGRRVPTWVGLLALLEDFVATWDTDAAGPERRDDGTFIRDGWRCAAPGCSSRRNLQDHHVVYRSHLGSDDGSNRVTLCCFHHLRGEHGGLMSVRGRAPLGLTWRLGRPDVAVTYRAESLVED
ncbi:MAG TPA: DUF222 domain-containing protein, partial [Candidatus Polarisedimenticolia bacterium]|nr:DUF222 domain-containing protein [Candidatus Polarisedimenticolia bacterium]